MWKYAGPHGRQKKTSVRMTNERVIYHSVKELDGQVLMMSAACRLFLGPHSAILSLGLYNSSLVPTVVAS